MFLETMTREELLELIENDEEIQRAIKEAVDRVDALFNDF